MGGSADSQIAKRRTDGGTDARIATAVVALLSVYPTTPLSAQCPDGTPPPCRAQPTRAAPPPNSVAVLYFDNLSRDTADAYLADGLTEELISHLGQLDRLAVASRYAVRRHRGAVPEPRMLSRALGVAHLLTGSVRRAGRRLRVTVELVRASSGERVWGQQYDREDTDLLDVQEDIARTVATTIAGRLLPQEHASLATQSTQEPAAYDHFLRGNYYLAQRNPRSVARAAEEYEAAAHLDPRFTAALGRIGLCYEVSLFWGWDLEGLPPESLLARGFAATDRALRQDSASSDAWMARGALLALRHPRTYEGVMAALERAIALDPRNAEAVFQYGYVLRELGKDSAAVAAFLRSLAIEPERPITLLTLARSSLYERRYQEAARWSDSALVMDPGLYQAYAQRARARLQLGRSAEARSDAETAVRLAVGDRAPEEAVLALVEAHTGDSQSARARVERVLAGMRDPRWAPYGTAFLGAVLVALGEPAQALDFLERLSPRGARLWYQLRAPEFDALRSHPRFERLIQESRPPEAPR